MTPTTQAFNAMKAALEMVVEEIDGTFPFESLEAAKAALKLASTTDETESELAGGNSKP